MSRSSIQHQKSRYWIATKASSDACSPTWIRTNGGVHGPSNFGDAGAPGLLHVPRRHLDPVAELEDDLENRAGDYGYLVRLLGDRAVRHPELVHAAVEIMENPKRDLPRAIPGAQIPENAVYR